MKLLMSTFIIFAGLNLYNVSFAKSDHKGDDHKEDHHKHKKKDDHKDHDHGAKDKHSSSGHDDHGEEKFGKGKAILEVKKEGKLFKLAAGAIKTLKIESIKLDSDTNNTYEVPASSVVDFQDEIGVYKRKGNWFELVDIKIINMGKYSSRIQSKNLSKGDEIISKGVALLRVAHLEASGQGGKGHVH